MPKQTHGVYIQAVTEEGAAALSRWQQVYRAVHDSIANGALAPGSRLPSARQLARDWQVSRGAVDEAFDQLQAEGLLMRRVGDGTYVTAHAARMSASRPAAAPAAARVVTNGASHRAPGAASPAAPSDAARGALRHGEPHARPPAAPHAASYTASHAASRAGPSTSSHAAAPAAPDTASRASPHRAVPRATSHAPADAGIAAAGPDAQRPAQPAAGPRQLPAGRWEAAQAAEPPPTLHPRAAALDLFPLDRWRRLMVQAHGDRARIALIDDDPSGLPLLREAIARHLGAARGLECRADQVFVVDSPAQGIALIARVLLEAGDTVWVEDPSHPSMPMLLQTLGARVVGVPLDGEGFDVAGAQALAPQARLAYLHPLAQYPLALRTSRARGDALLAWAAAERRWIVEGNFNDELVRPGASEPALMRRDADQRVMMLGTFEGVLFPSLRVAYVVVPSPLVPAFARVRGLQGHHTAGGTQWALAQFIDGGHLDSHLRVLREQLARNRIALRESLSWMLPPGVRVGPLDHGAHFCLHLPPSLRDVDVAARLRRQGVVVEPLSKMAWQVGGLNALVIGYAAWPAPVLVEALRVVGRTLTEALPAAPAPPPRTPRPRASYQPTGENT